jgi:hypothetical protein
MRSGEITETSLGAAFVFGGIPVAPMTFSEKMTQHPCFFIDKAGMLLDSYAHPLQPTMVALEAFSELLLVLYSAPLQQEQSQRFHAFVCDHTRSQNSHFLSADTPRGLATLAQGGKLNDPAVLSEYNKTFSRNDPFPTPLIRKARTGVFTEDELLPGDGILRTQIYREFLVHSIK